MGIRHPPNTGRGGWRRAGHSLLKRTGFYAGRQTFCAKSRCQQVTRSDQYGRPWTRSSRQISLRVRWMSFEPLPFPAKALFSRSQSKAGAYGRKICGLMCVRQPFADARPASRSGIDSQEDKASLRLWAKAASFVSRNAETGLGAPQCDDAFSAGFSGGVFMALLPLVQRHGRFWLRSLRRQLLPEDQLC